MGGGGEEGERSVLKEWSFNNKKKVQYLYNKFSGYQPLLRRQRVLTKYLLNVPPQKKIN